jgi:hypothetical protein
MFLKGLAFLEVGKWMDMIPANVEYMRLLKKMTAVGSHEALSGSIAIFYSKSELIKSKIGV